MKPTYVKSGGCLHVREHFAKDNLRNSSRDVKIEFSDKACIKAISSSVLSEVGERYYKVTADALRVCGELVCVVRPNVEVVGKGLVAEKIFTSMAEKVEQADFVLCVGDDRSDEDMFEIIGSAISGNILFSDTYVFACTVGQKLSKAKYYLDDSSEVILMLENLVEATDSSASSPLNQRMTYFLEMYDLVGSFIHFGSLLHWNVYFRISLLLLSTKNSLSAKRLNFS